LEKPQLQTAYLKLRHEIRSALGQYPGLFVPLSQLFPRQTVAIVRQNTEVVIEGYPRSANTFAVLAFKVAQQRPIRIAHHRHVPAQVIWAARRDLPILVLVRSPLDAVLSRAIRTPFLSIEQCLRDYIRFYARLVPYQGKFMVSTFDQVVQDYGQVISRLNNRFNTSFGVFEHTPENVGEVFEMIEQKNLRRTAGEQVSEATISRPSPSRKRTKIQLVAKIQAHHSLLSAAESLYEQFAEMA
jgi:hypothetical protein